MSYTEEPQVYKNSKLLNGSMTNCWHSQNFHLLISFFQSYEVSLAHWQVPQFDVAL